MRIGAWRRKRCAEPLCRRGLPCGAAVPPCGSPRALPCGSPCALPRALPRGICPCVAPLPLRQCMRRGAFSCGRGDCALRGACPPTLPADRTAVVSAGGGVSGWSAADRAVPEAARGACLFSRLPTLPLAFFTAPIPPPPFPAGRGRDYSFLMQGAAPLASPGLNPRGTYSPNKKGTRRGACLVCLLPALTLVCFVAPIPPTALAERSSPPGKGETKVFSCKGLRPLHPRG